jgi:serine/threonine-protein kinase
VGTLAYMSPEQRRGEAPQPSDDIYAAAVVLFEMLTGHPPWARDAALAGHRDIRDFRLPTAVLANAPVELATAVQNHLDRLGDLDPAARPSTPDAVAVAQRLREQAIAARLP